MPFRPLGVGVIATLAILNGLVGASKSKAAFNSTTFSRLLGASERLTDDPTVFSLDIN